MSINTIPKRPRIPNYYEALGLGTDKISRCKDCQTLITDDELLRRGRCKCGNRRFAEVTTLSEQEAADIRSGKIRFPHSDLFLAEFSPEDGGSDE